MKKTGDHMNNQRNNIINKLIGNKKAFVGLWADVFKGLMFGAIIGIVLAFLIFYNVIPLGIEFCG